MSLKIKGERSARMEGLIEGSKVSWLLEEKTRTTNTHDSGGRGMTE